ncbi:hypothetical protein F5880DRAFT_1610496 [Lentinula raphanica]|nr:hypothetical protein F5880DRAFT_1610496 [Lentinula raphanica]
MIRFAFRVILFLGVISSGVLAAPTSMPRSIVEVQALQSSDHAIAGPPMVSMLETRVDEPKVHNIEDLITTLTGFLPNQEPQKESLKNRIDNLRKLDRENGDDVPQTAAAIMHDALSDNHFACLDSNVSFPITIRQTDFMADYGHFTQQDLQLVETNNSYLDRFVGIHVSVGEQERSELCRDSICPPKSKGL